MTSGSGSTVTINTNVLMALVILLLALGSAASGWIILKAMEMQQGVDPFEAEREYDVTGTYSGEEVTGTVTGKYISESDALSLKMYDVYYASGTYTRVEILFDSSRAPLSDKYTNEGADGDCTLWSYTNDDGFACTFKVDSKSVVQGFTVAGGDLELTCTLKV